MKDSSLHGNEHPNSIRQISWTVERLSALKRNVSHGVSRYALRVSPSSKRMHTWLMDWLVNGFIVDWCETKTHQTTDQIQSYCNRMLPNCGELCFLYIICISHTIMSWSPFRNNVKRKYQAPRQHISAVTREANNEALQINTCISLYTQSFSVNFVLKRPQFTWATKDNQIHVRMERKENCGINESADANKVIWYICQYHHFHLPIQMSEEQSASSRNVKT